MPVAWLAPAHKSNPFQIIKSVDYHGAGGNLGIDEENADASQNADAQMANAGADPDVEPEADAQGTGRRARLPRAVPVAAPARPRNCFGGLVGDRREPARTRPPGRLSRTGGIFGQQ